MKKCKICEGQLNKNGVDNGVQRFRCKNCGKYSSDSEPKYSAETKAQAIEMYLNNCGVRKIALFIGCSPGTILNWIREAAAKIETIPQQIDGDIIEMDEIYAQTDRQIAAVIKKNERTQ